MFCAVVPTWLCLIRHAESVWNAAGRWQGHGDPPLSLRGREQADALARELADQALEALVCSDLQRTRETAAALARATGLPVRADPRWRELDVGRWTGLSRDQIERRHGASLARFDAGDPDARPEAGETRRELGERARRAAEALAEAHPGRRVAVVTHLGVIRALAGVDSVPNTGWHWVAWSAEPQRREISP